jgi:putative ABC transport system substrate-binding protein
LKAEVIVANGTPSLVAVRELTSTVPTVFVSVADPVGQGFVPSLARPGGNVTGFSAEEASMGGKWLELLKELAPRVSRIAVIYNPQTAPYAPMFFPAMQAAAPGMAVALSISVPTAADIDRVIADIGREQGGGLIVVPDSFMFGQRNRITTLAGKYRLPAMYPLGIFIPDGGLIAYGIDTTSIAFSAAHHRSTNGTIFDPKM